MSNQLRPAPKTVTLTVPSPVNPGIQRVPAHSAQVSSLHRLPAIAVVGNSRVVCNTRRLPFKTESFASIRATSLLEFAIDDEALVQEIARILIPGGEFSVAVPNALGFGRLDALNAYRYATDIIHRGHEVPELSEVGWRRHYAPAELEGMLRHAGFSNVQSRTYNIGIPELRTIAALIRQIRSRENPALLAQPVRGVFARSDFGIRLPLNLGALLVFTANRKSTW